MFRLEVCRFVGFYCVLILLFLFFIFGFLVHLIVWEVGIDGEIDCAGIVCCTLFFHRVIFYECRGLQVPYVSRFRLFPVFMFNDPPIKTQMTLFQHRDCM
jgi:hypothetical protein